MQSLAPAPFPAVPAVSTWFQDGLHPRLWGCRDRFLRSLYRDAVRPGSAVLEVGPGSGRHLAAVKAPGLTVDLLEEPHRPLPAAAARLARYRPRLHYADLLGRWPLAAASVDVAVMSMVAHRVPGVGLDAKVHLWDEQARVVRPGGTVAGATVPALGVPHTKLSREVLARFNATGFHHNRADHMDDLVRLLEDRFDGVHIALAGTVVLWRARVR